MQAPAKPLSTAEFVTLLATMVSMLALATDIMLPALDLIGRDLKVGNANDAQLVVSALFLGFALGQFIAGPVSDAIGRKPVIYGGFALFIIGCLMSFLATDFAVMLAGRALQGLGAAGPRVVSMAIVRDGYEGRAMARIISIVMTVFIIVPTVAPAIGQGIILVAGWRATFASLLVMAAVTLAWFAMRQPETLPIERRRSLSYRAIADGVGYALGLRAVVGYTTGAGFVFGAFLGYLNCSQQIFTVAYGTGVWFPIYFGTAALALGAATIFNSRVVMRLGMRYLTRRAILGLTVLAAAFLPVVILFDGVPPLWAFMGWLMASFFCFGIVFGNFNALAMEPLGDLAGLGAALVGALSMLIALPIGWVVGHYFDGGVTPLVSSFAALGLVSVALIAWAEAEPGNR